MGNMFTVLTPITTTDPYKAFGYHRVASNYDPAALWTIDMADFTTANEVMRHVREQEARMPAVVYTHVPVAKLEMICEGVFRDEHESTMMGQTEWFVIFTYYSFPLLAFHNRNAHANRTKLHQPSNRPAAFMATFTLESNCHNSSF